MRAISIIILTFLLLACSQGGPGGGAVGGGPVLSSSDGPPGGTGSAAQPLDAGFSGPGKDIEGLGYYIYDAKGRALCKEANGDFRVKLSGVVIHSMSQKPVAGFLTILDLSAQRFLVTRTANEGEAGEPGNFVTTMALRPPFQIYFGMLYGEYHPLETLQAVNEDGLGFNIKAEPQPALTIEGAGDVLPCLQAQSSHTFETVPSSDSAGDSDEALHVPDGGHPPLGL